MLIAIDHGNHACKTVHFNFVSGLAQHSVRPPMADEVLEYNGEFWTLSGQRLPYRRDKTRDESFFILTLFAIAKELANAGPLPSTEKIDLAVGCRIYERTKNNAVTVSRDAEKNYRTRGAV